MAISKDRTFQSAWADRTTSFAEWLSTVSDSFVGSHLSIEPAARLVGTTPAELEAALRLATLDEQELRRFGTRRPPKTTWFVLADSSPDAVRAVAELLEQEERAVTSTQVVQKIESVDGASSLDQIAQLDADVFAHMAKKAEQYGALTQKTRNALKSFGSRKRGGRPLTVRQVGFAQNLLTQLADESVISRNSPDGDQEMCDLVLDALGR